jgi:uncharacterized protein (TIGR04255 family)
MATRITSLPVYEKPPVNEVVCGILFERINELLNPYLGMLWAKYRSEYAKCQEVAPLVPVIENFDQQERELEILPFPRTWFVHTNERRIIQVQRDRFLHNWRKMQPDDEYPRYENVIKDFRTYLAKFIEFLEENELKDKLGNDPGKLQPLQYELTYINYLIQGEGWETINDIDKVFPNFSWQKGKNSFLTSPDTINWQTSFAFPDSAGRLHAKLQSAIRREDQRQAIVFELTARGIGSYTTLDTMWNWFELAHDWIVRGFTDLTSPQVQRDIWRKKI